MPTAQSPTLRRRRLAAELRRLRGDRPGRQVAKALGWSTSKVSRYELGRTPLPIDEVKRLLEYYGVINSRRAELLSLAHEANERGWWEEYAYALSEENQDFIGLEAEAASVAMWSVEVMPGLLQTEKYARQLHVGHESVIPVTPQVIDARVKVRMIRQEILTRESPLELSVVIDESVLLRPIGGPKLMYDQLQHLTRVADLPNIDLRVMPLGRERSLVANSFTIFGFNPTAGGEKLHDVVSLESTIRSDLYVEGETDTYFHRLLFQRLADQASSPAESHSLVRRLLKRYQT